MRKERLDAAAAAIILQDYLDTRPARPVIDRDDPTLMKKTLDARCVLRPR